MAVDRSFERRLAGLVNGRAAAALHARAQGRRKGVPQGHPARPDRRDSPPASPGLGTDERAHHDRLLRGADRAGDAGLPRDLGAHPVPLRPAPVRVSAPGRRIALGDEHAVRDRRRPEHPDRRIRFVERRPDEDRLSARARPALRTGHAGDLRGPFQLLVSRACVAGARRPVREPRRRAGFPLRRVLRAAAQLPPPRLDRPLPVRQLAGHLPVVPAGPQGGLAAGVHARKRLCAPRDVAADERPRLSEQEPGRDSTSR